MSNYKNICLADNGARFHNVDLHVHSYGGSHDVQDKGMTPENIIDSAVKQGLGVIAITDHNSNINTQRALDHSKQYTGKLLVLPGVEVSTAHGHLLAYFAPGSVASLGTFLSRLNLIGSMGNSNTRTAKSMVDVISECHNLGGISIAAHIDREKTGFDLISPGFPNWKKDILTSPGLYGVECDAIASLVWYSENDEACSEGIERTKLFAARKAVEELSARHHLAHVQGSDAHSMARFEHADPSKAWTRIKLTELSYEALRVALVDPTARVRACGSLPRSMPRIRGMSVTGGFLHGETIHFSNNLNCFIGGRGTGKSTAIRAIAYAFGLNDDFGTYGNCPDAISVYCEDVAGTLYHYQRTRGGDTNVTAKEDESATDMPTDSFHIEYFGQGELAEVAKDPLKSPELFQAFLDRHTSLRDLIETEKSLVESLRENAGRLEPVENAFANLTAKKESLKEVEKKLKLAEDGHLRDIVSTQSKLASEKTVREAIEGLAAEYTTGWTLNNIPRSFDQIKETAGQCTDDEASKHAMEAMKTSLTKSNAAVKQKELELNSQLKLAAKEFIGFASDLKASHLRMSAEVVAKLAELKSRGIATDIPGLEALLRLKTSLAKDIAAVEQRGDERRQSREQRVKLLDQLYEVRKQMTERRKLQLKGINANLALTIRDYTVFVRYDDAGITAEFETFMQEKMHGTYLQDNVIENVCRRITPSELAKMVLARDHIKISTTAKVSSEWSGKIVEKLCYWNILFELEVLAKLPKPIITVRTKATPAVEIPVLQLSDGQRHTILLTIAMLAESNDPLIIDQPEDDLDNAFIFSSIVTTLRTIKERRQVILVTHNANIAVLGDSELILPMTRENDIGMVKDRGSIDSSATKRRVEDILEGGPEAFLRRKEMYNH